MARSFNGSTDYLHKAAAVVAAEPCTLACWFRTSVTAGIQTPMSVAYDAAGGDEGFWMRLQGSNVRASKFDGSGSGSTAVSASTYTTSAWQHAAAVFASTTSRAAYINGGGKGSDAGNIGAFNDGLNHTYVGVFNEGSALNYFMSGDVAEAGVWNIALSDAEILALSQGVSPLMVRPEALVAYWPILGYASPELDLMVGRAMLTAVGTSAQTHPPILYRKPARAWSKPLRGAPLTATQAETATLTTAKRTLNYSALAPSAGQIASVSTVKQTLNYLSLLATQGEIATVTRYAPTHNTDTLAATQGELASLSLAKTVFNTTLPVMTIGGANAGPNVLMDSLRLDDILNEQPNQAIFQVVGSTPPVLGQDVQIGLGSTSARNVIFGGTITTIEQIYRGIRANVTWNVTVQDYTYLLNRRHPIRRYTNSAANAIVIDLVSSFSTGFTTTHVASSLATLSIDFDGTETLAACLTALANLAGCYWYVDYQRDIHFFVTEVTGNPSAIDVTNISIGDGARELAYGTDLSQIRTRILLRGAGSRAMADVTPAMLTLPLQDATVFNTGGGSAISGPMTFDYASKSSLTNDGTTSAGLPIAMVSHPAITSVNGGQGSIIGNVAYKMTCLVSDALGNARGESEVTLASGNAACSPVADNLANAALTSQPIGTIPVGSYTYLFRWTTGLGETAGSVVTISYTGAQSGVFTASAFPDSRVVGLNIYRSKVGVGTGGPFFSIGSITTSGGTFTDNITDSSGGGIASADASGNRQNTTGDSVTVAITAGPSTGDLITTSRKIYRTKAGGSVFYFLTTVGDNVTISLVDKAGDTSLGDPAPTESKVKQLAGSLLVWLEECAQVGNSGWVQVGNNVVYYTANSGPQGGTTRGYISGIPASGSGSLASDVSFGASVTNIPYLFNISARSDVGYTIPSGDDVSLYYVANDVAAQTALAAIEGGDGVHEYSITDGSILSVTAAALRAAAELLQFKSSQAIIRYRTRDIATRSGKSITVTLGTPTNISVTLQIQRVTWTQFNVPNSYPLIEVEASATKFTLQDLLRRLDLQV